MTTEYKIGDLVVKVDSIADDTLYTISETPCIHGLTVVLDGYRYQTGVQFIRPATIEESNHLRRITH